MWEEIELIVAKIVGTILCLAFILFSFGCFLAAFNWVMRLLGVMM